MQPNYTPEGVEAMRQFYRRNRTPREMPHGHHCNECGVDWECAKEPCYGPPNAPFSLCDACIEKNMAATLAIMEEMEYQRESGEALPPELEAREHCSIVLSEE